MKQGYFVHCIYIYMYMYTMCVCVHTMCIAALHGHCNHFAGSSDLCTYGDLVT